MSQLACTRSYVINLPSGSVAQQYSPSTVFARDYSTVRVLTSLLTACVGFLIAALVRAVRILVFRLLLSRLE